ncbi:unnamed protein product [Closterium sp. NIES-54]
MRNSFVEFNGEVFQQVRGTAMGTPVAVCFAILFMSRLDELLKERCDKLGVHHSPSVVVFAGLQRLFMAVPPVLYLAATRCATAAPRCVTAAPRCATAASRCATAASRCATAASRCATAASRCATAAPRCVTAAPRCATAASRCATAASRCATAATKCAKSATASASCRHHVHFHSHETRLAACIAPHATCPPLLPHLPSSPLLPPSPRPSAFPLLLKHFPLLAGISACEITAIVFYLQSLHWLLVSYSVAVSLLPLPSPLFSSIRFKLLVPSQPMSWEIVMLKGVFQLMSWPLCKATVRVIRNPRAGKRSFQMTRTVAFNSQAQQHSHLHVRWLLPLQVNNCCCCYKGEPTALPCLPCIHRALHQPCTILASSPASTTASHRAVTPTRSSPSHSHCTSLTPTLIRNVPDSLLPSLTPVTRSHSRTISPSFPLIVAPSLPHSHSSLHHLSLIPTHRCTISHSFPLIVAPSLPHSHSSLHHLSLIPTHRCTISHSFPLIVAPSLTHSHSSLHHLSLIPTHRCTISPSFHTYSHSPTHFHSAVSPFPTLTRTVSLIPIRTRIVSNLHSSPTNSHTLPLLPYALSHTNSNSYAPSFTHRHSYLPCLSLTPALTHTAPFTITVPLRAPPAPPTTLPVPLPLLMPPLTSSAPPHPELFPSTSPLGFAITLITPLFVLSPTVPPLLLHPAPILITLTLTSLPIFAPLPPPPTGTSLTSAPFLIPLPSTPPAAITAANTSCPLNSLPLIPPTRLLLMPPAAALPIRPPADLLPLIPITAVLLTLHTSAPLASTLLLHMPPRLLSRVDTPFPFLTAPALPLPLMLL